jgi:hypothetical protein
MYGLLNTGRKNIEERSGEKCGEFRLVDKLLVLFQLSKVRAAIEKLPMDHISII